MDTISTATSQCLERVDCVGSCRIDQCYEKMCYQRKVRAKAFRRQEHGLSFEDLEVDCAYMQNQTRISKDIQG